jgi:hypothetical protein
MLRRRTVCVLGVAARTNGPYRLATEVGIQGPFAVRQIQESALIGRLWPSYRLIRFSKPVIDDNVGCRDAR